MTTEIWFLVGIFGYFLGLILAALFLSRHMVGWVDFFLAGRMLPPFFILVTVLASWIGAGSTMGTMNAGFFEGLGGLWLMAIPAVLSCGITAFVIAPKAQSSGLFSLPQAIKQAYGSKVSVLFAAVVLLASTTIMSSQLIAFIDVFSVMLPHWDPLPLISAVYALIVVYSVLGGFKVVAVTDIFQFSLVLFAVLVLFGLSAWQFAHTPLAVDHLMEKTTPGFWNIFYDLPKHLSMTLTFCLAWCIAPEFWQRIAALPDGASGQKMVLQATLIFPIIYGIILLTGILASSVLPASAVTETNNVFLILVKQIPWVWLSVLVMVGLVSALASTLDSALNIASLTISHDVVEPFFMHHLSRTQQVLVSRLSMALIGLPAVGIALFYRDLIKMLWISADIYASCVFVPLMGYFYFRKHCGVASGLLSVGLGLVPVLLNFAKDFHLLALPHYWPAYPYTTLLGVVLSVLGFVLGGKGVRFRVCNQKG